MAEDEPQHRDMVGSSATFPTDSENYESSNNDLSPSPPSSSRSPLILYSPPTIWGLLRGAAINLLLPFVNGLMLGFGELLAHEAAFRLGWSGTKVDSEISLVAGFRRVYHTTGLCLLSQYWRSTGPIFLLAQLKQC